MTALDFSVSSSPLQMRMKRLFAEGFLALDIAEPLLSFDASHSAKDLRQFMIQRDLTVAGVRRRGKVVGYIWRKDLRGVVQCGEVMQSFVSELVLHEEAPLSEAIKVLGSAEYCCFIEMLGQVGAIVTKSDVQKPPVRMWLFGLITIIEMFMTRVIEKSFPKEGWLQEIRPSRLRRAQELYDDRVRSKRPARLIDCLYLVDKAHILMKDPTMREDFGFVSKKAGERAIGQFESLRNALAHSNDIVTFDWNSIVRMAERLEKIMTRI